MEKTFNAVSLIQTISGKLRDEKLKNISDVERVKSSFLESILAPIRCRQ